MKDSPFLSNILSEATVSALEAVAGAPNATFQEQVKLAGLDHAQDLQNADLRGVDLTDSDIRGFNFSGADLRGATGIRVEWDASTVFDGADLSGSIFASKLRLQQFFRTDERASKILTAVARQSWANQAVWAAENLMSTGRFRDIAPKVTEALFYRAVDDDFLQAELMRYLAPRLESRQDLHEMLIAAISEEPEAAVVVRSALSLFRQHQMISDPVVRQQALALAGSRSPNIQAEAIRFIMRNKPAPAEFQSIRSIAASAGEYIASVYVAEAARRFGDAYDLVTRDPVSNSTFNLITTITPNERYLIARRWLRAESSRDANDLKLPLAQRKGGVQYFEKDAVEARALKVDELWLNLKKVGIEIAVG